MFELEDLPATPFNFSTLYNFGKNSLGSSTPSTRLYSMGSSGLSRENGGPSQKQPIEHGPALSDQQIASLPGGSNLGLEGAADTVPIITSTISSLDETLAQPSSSLASKIWPNRHHLSLLTWRICSPIHHQRLFLEEVHELKQSQRNLGAFVQFGMALFGKFPFLFCSTCPFRPLR